MLASFQENKTEETFVLLYCVISYQLQHLHNLTKEKTEQGLTKNSSYFSWYDSSLELPPPCFSLEIQIPQQISTCLRSERRRKYFELREETGK